MSTSSSGESKVKGVRYCNPIRVAKGNGPEKQYLHIERARGIRAHSKTRLSVYLSDRDSRAKRETEPEIERAAEKDKGCVYF